MRLTLASESCVRVDLRAAGLLRAVGHDPTLVARCDAMTVETTGDGVDLVLEVRFPVDRIEPPTDLDAGDRARMRDNLRGPDVLDAAKHPAIVWRGRYVGTTTEGRLEGELLLRGVSRPLAMAVLVAREDNGLLARGSWSGRLTHLGIRPFRALMGALRLEDSITLRLEAHFVPVAPGE